MSEIKEKMEVNTLTHEPFNDNGSFVINENQELLITNKADETLDFHDLISTALTCTYLKPFILSNNSLWKAKYVKRWPKIYKIAPDITHDYYTEVRYVFNIRANVRQILVTLATNCMHKEELSGSDFKPLEKLIVSRCLNREYIIEYLKEIISDNSEINTLDVVPVTTPGNLTLKYYSLSLLRYLHKMCLSSKWHAFLSLPDENQIAETAATMLMQWCKLHDEINMEYVSRKLDMIAEEVKNCLKQQNPGHPLFKITEDVRRGSREKYLTKNQFSMKHCQEILLAMNKIFYMEMGFHGDKADYPCINSSFITDVLETKRGVLIMLSIIYESIVRRLGIKLDLVNCFGRFMLRFTEEDHPSVMYYIDLLDKGKIYTGVDFLFGNEYIPSLSRVTTKELIKETWSDIEIALHNPNQPMLETSHFLKLNFDFHEMLKLYDQGVIISEQQFYSPQQDCQILSLNDSNTKRTVCRSPEILYAVGMIVKHKPDGGTYVICGWDRVCEGCNNWQKQVYKSLLKNGMNQPFYHLLGENGWKRYTAQESLRVTSSRGGLGLNDEVGRFFSHFHKNHYVPNCAIQDEYPDDVHVRKQYHCELLGLSTNV